MSCDERSGELILDTHSLTSPTFMWSLQTMGVSCLTVQISNSVTDIGYNEESGELHVTGDCVLYSGWETVCCTITISAGDAEHTILYANTSIEAVYGTFYLPLIADAKIIPRGTVESKVLPNYSFVNVPLTVVSTSKSTLPNCVQRFGITDLVEVTPPWTVVEQLTLVTDSLGFLLENSLNKSGVVTRSFLLNGRVSFGPNYVVPITVSTSVDYFSQKEIWNITVTDRQKPVVDVEGLASRAVAVDLRTAFPPPLLAQPGEYVLHAYHVQYNPETSVVHRVVMTATAPKLPWEVIPRALTLHDTSFGISLCNPFSEHNRSIDVHILGKCSVAASNFEPVLGCGAAGNGQQKDEWCFEITGELPGLLGSTSTDEHMYLYEGKICVNFSGVECAVVDSL